MSNLLDYIKSIVDKTPIELDKSYTQYGLNIYFSKYKNCIFYLDFISNMELTDEQHYKYLMNVIPMGWQKKLEYPKENVKKDKDINILCYHFNIKSDEAKQYLYLIEETEMNKLRKLYKDWIENV